MRTLSAVSDKLVALLAPEATAAAACPIIDSWCDGGCPFWWWRRKYARKCPGSPVTYEYKIGRAHV